MDVIELGFLAVTETVVDAFGNKKVLCVNIGGVVGHVLPTALMKKTKSVIKVILYD